MKNKLALLFLALSACTTAPIAPAPAPMPSPAPVTVSLDPIRTLASSSACAKYDWQDQGVAPKAYTVGMALAYARAICQANPDVSRPLSDDPESVRDTTDAISWFNSNFVNAGLANSPMLRKVYVLMLGEGMRESSGRYCCGHDQNEDDETADEAEAGLFQTSWNSHEVSDVAESALLKIWNAPTSNCINDFKVGVSCDSEDLQNTGDPKSTGYAFQAREKNCPAFAVDYTAVAFRTERKEYQPLNKKTAEIVPACDGMLAQVEMLMKASPGLCGLL